MAVLALLGPGALDADSPSAEPPVPESLREGWGFSDDIRDLGEALGGYELAERDVDCDGRPEVLLLVAARRDGGAVHGTLLFDQRESGFLYMGETGSVRAVLDYGSEGGCYLVTHGRPTASPMKVRLWSVAGGEIRSQGRVDLWVANRGFDEDRALFSAFGAGGLSLARLRRVFEDAGALFSVGEPGPLPWVERSTVESVVETVEGYGPQPFERVFPLEVGEAGESAFWGRVSPRVARSWASAVETALRAHELAGSVAHWLPPAGSDRLQIHGGQVEEAVRLSRPMGRPPAGLAIGRFDAEIARPVEPAYRVEITWAAVFEISPLGEPEMLLRLFLGTTRDGETRRLFRLDRLSNLDHDPEPELVLDETAYAGRVQWLLDLSRPGELEPRRLHADAWD